MNLLTSVTTRIEAVTFDAGGTLIEPWPSVGAVYAEVAREFGIDCRADTLNAQFSCAWKSRTNFNYTREDWFDVVRASFTGYAEVSPEFFDAIYDRFAQPGAWLICADVVPTLQRLEALGVKLAVISNWDDRLIPLLEKLGLATYFEHILVSSLVGAHKPDRQIFLRAAAMLEVQPGRMLHVGDSQREDVQGARGAGAIALRIRRSGSDGPDDVSLLTAIPDLLEKAINA